VTPNYAVVDGAGRVYVSDSNVRGIYRFELDGSGELWCDEPFNFANGLALAPDGRSLTVAETSLPGLTRMPIGADGSAGPAETVVARSGVLPDGVPAVPVGCSTSAATSPARSSA